MLLSTREVMRKIGYAFTAYLSAITLFFFYVQILALQQARNAAAFTFVHGYSSASFKGRSYIDSGIIPDKTTLFDFDDAYRRLKTGRGYGVSFNVLHSSLGQDADIKRLVDVVKNHQGTVVPFGESRGAATIINCVGGKYLDKARIGALILDSPFDTIKSVLAHKLKLYSLQKILSPKTLEAAVPFVCWGYNPLGPQPIDTISGIDSEIPVLLICSIEDDVVPYTSSIALYKRLLEVGHKKAYLLVLQRGKHGSIMKGPQAARYRHVVHAFYEKHTIKHGIQVDHKILSSGLDFLDDFCRPNLDELTKLYGECTQPLF